MRNVQDVRNCETHVRCKLLFPSWLHNDIRVLVMAVIVSLMHVCLL